MASNNYTNLFVAAGITDRGTQERYGEYLDAVIVHEAIDAGDIVGVGTCPDLYVVTRHAVIRPYTKGLFKNKRIEMRRECAISVIATLKTTTDGLKPLRLALKALDASGADVLKIVWGFDSIESPAAQRQREHLFQLIGNAMDRLNEGPPRPSVALASSKAGALMDWAADVVKAADVPVTAELVERQANIVAGGLRLMVFLQLDGIDDLAKLYPDHRMPPGSNIATFDDLYERVVARVGNAQAVDHAIDSTLAGAWNEFIAGIREESS